jgi:SAM-dependent methyltransferase
MISGGALANRVPWWGKILAKLVLARLPVSHRVWRRTGLFLHGAMDDPAYAWRIFSFHLTQYHRFSGHSLPGDVLELGPGDSAFSGAFGAALGIRRTCLVDVGSYLRWDADARKRAAAFLAKTQPGVTLPDGPGLAGIRTEYLTSGLESLRSLPDASMDLIWSQAVLEHLPRQAFPAFLVELRRIIRPGGVLSHRVDLKDHVGGGLNHLRFPPSVWESTWFRTSGFYTNRLRRRELLSAFSQAGFEVAMVREERWPQLPTPRLKLDKAFRTVPEEELLVSGLDIVLRPIGGPG